MKSKTIEDREALHKAIYDCTLCKDRGYPVKRVQPEWDPRKVHTLTDVWGMLIGQSPDITEFRRSREVKRIEMVSGPNDKRLHPRIAFIGATGRRLGKWLIEDAGFTEDQVRTRFHKTAVTKCFPGKDKRGGDRRPTKEEIKLCSRFLKKQIRLLNPVILIPIGKVATNWFFPEVEKLEEVVGKKLWWPEDKKNHTVICLPHPSSASGWWKIESNQPLLEQSKRILSELRQALCA